MRLCRPDVDDRTVRGWHLWMRVVLGVVVPLAVGLWKGIAGRSVWEGYSSFFFSAILCTSALFAYRFFGVVLEGYLEKWEWVVYWYRRSRYWDTPTPGLEDAAVQEHPLSDEEILQQCLMSMGADRETLLWFTGPLFVGLGAVIAAVIYTRGTPSAGPMLVLVFYMTLFGTLFVVHLCTPRSLVSLFQFCVQRLRLPMENETMRVRLAQLAVFVLGWFVFMASVCAIQWMAGLRHLLTSLTALFCCQFLLTRKSGRSRQGRWKIVSGQPQLTQLLFAVMYGAVLVFLFLIGSQVKFPTASSDFKARTATAPVRPLYDNTAPVCTARWMQGRYGVMDFAFLSYAAYFDDAEVQRRYLQTWFPSRNVTLVYNSSQHQHQTYHDVVFYEFWDREANVSIVAVRGTTDAIDILQDFRIWGDSLALGFLDILGPFSSLWPYSLTSRLIEYSADLKRMLIPDIYQFSYLTRLREYVGQRRRDGAELVLTGHSLGGGLAKLIGAIYRMKVVTFSSPGILWANNIQPPEASIGELTLISQTVAANSDPIPRVDRLEGCVQYIDCDAGYLGCHSLDHTICELLKMCGDVRPGANGEDGPRFGRRFLAGCNMSHFTWDR